MGTNQNWGFYQMLRPSQIDAIKNVYPIAYLPWGAIEYHGKHNPVGLDSTKAFRLSVEMAKCVGGIVMPTVDFSANLIKSYPGVDFKDYSIEFSEKLVESICKEYLNQLAEQEFKIIVILSGHAGEPHLSILKKVAENFNQKNNSQYCWAFAEFEILPKALLKANHSGYGETSIQLYYEPSTVSLKTLPKNREITLNLDAVTGGDPRKATAVQGEKIVKNFIKIAQEEMKILFEKYILE